MELLLINTGSDAILLGAETLRGFYPVQTISTVGKICSEVSASHSSLIFLILQICRDMKFGVPFYHFYG